MTTLGLILESLSFLGISYCLIRLYVASRINRRHRFCEELVYGDVAFIPFEGRVGGTVNRAGGGGRVTNRAAVTRTKQSHIAHDKGSL